MAAQIWAKERNFDTCKKVIKPEGFREALEVGSDGRTFRQIHQLKFDSCQRQLPSLCNYRIICLQARAVAVLWVKSKQQFKQGLGLPPQLQFISVKLKQNRTLKNSPDSEDCSMEACGTSPSPHRNASSSLDAPPLGSKQAVQGAEDPRATQPNVHGQ